MLSESNRVFLAQTHRGVLTTFRRNGGAQMSIISCGPYRNGVAFTVTSTRSKLWNLKRDPRCSLLVSNENWWGFLVLEGHAEILSSDNTDPEEFRLALRDVYRTASGEEHPNWDEYDQAMRDDKRSVILVVPEQVYGTAA
jgi:PPOX class probable F420-dependent enzyme